MKHTYSDEEIERCTIRNRGEIIYLLRSLIRRGEPVSVLFQEGRQSFLTILLGVSESDNLLYFDIGGSDETNHAFLKAEQSTFSTLVEGIRNQFSARKVRQATLHGEPAFAVPLPERFLRLQRREVFRLQLPTVKSYVCHIRRGSPQEETLPMHDISVGGIGILSTHPLAYEQLEKLNNCWINLYGTGGFPVTLEVRYTNQVESRTGKPLWHMGCKFINLSSINETLIQRFMARIESERRTLSAG